jgi:hypothetical protein
VLLPCRCGHAGGAITCASAHAATHLPETGISSARELRDGVRARGQSIAAGKARGGTVRRLIRMGAVIVLLSVSLCAESREKKAEEAVARRDLSGSVSDRNRHPVSGAVVYLKNTRTLSIRTYITGDDGCYSFNHLLPDVEYQVRAESAGHKSPDKTLSAFDTHRQPHINLELNHLELKK